MRPTFRNDYLGFHALEALSPHQVGAILGNAKVLQQAAVAGTTPALLRGRNFALMCDNPGTREALLFRRAAEELGAHVAHIVPGLSERSALDDVRDTARLLDRLYDAVECQGMAPTVVRQMGSEAAVPIFDGIACDDHPVTRLADTLDGDMPSADNRRYVLQAVLLGIKA